jgi:hypothetical protein
MKRNTGIKGLIITVAIVGLAGFAFAHGGGMMGGGNGDGYGMMGNGNGYGRGMMGNGNGYGYGMMNQGRGYEGPMGNYGYGNLSREDAARLQQAREKFNEATHHLRSAIRDKQDALQDELHKRDPDAGKISRLQRSLSQLRSEYDQKESAFERETRNMPPNR